MFIFIVVFQPQPQAVLVVPATNTL